MQSISCRVGSPGKEGETVVFVMLDKPAAAIAWEIDGASDASKIAKHAIQAVNRLVCRVIPMTKFYLCDQTTGESWDLADCLVLQSTRSRNPYDRPAWVGNCPSIRDLE